MTRATKFDVDEPLAQHGERDGLTAAYVTEVEPGADTVSIIVDCDELREAAAERLGDSCETVYVWATEEALAVTDRKYPASDTSAARLDQLRGVHREAVIAPPNEAVATMVRRDLFLEALDEVAGNDEVLVHVDPGHPLFLVGTDESVAIAPSRVADQGGEAA